MRRVYVLTCLLLAGPCYGGAIKSNGTGGGSWSAPGTWAGAVVPGDGDNITIQAGDTVIFDVDQSGFVDGIALAVNLGGKLQCSTSAGKYYVKCNTSILLNGVLQAGTSTSTPLPSNVTFTIDLNGNYTINCGPASTIELWCTEPTNKVVALSQAENAGATVFHVDANVTHDTWAAANEIRIDDVSGSLPDSEIRTVAAGGITATAITVTSGIMNAKATGAKVFLVTRNIRIINGTGYAISSPIGAYIAAEIGTTNGIRSGVNCTIGGIFSGCASGIVSGYGNIVRGIFSGCTCGIVAYGCSNTVNGTISGSLYGVTYVPGSTISAAISGCASGIYDCGGSTISGTVSGCIRGIVYGSGYLITGATFTDNSYDLQAVVKAEVYNSIMGASTENYQYNTNSVPAWSYVASYDHDQVVGAFKAWTRGGVIVSDVNTVPQGYGTSYKHMCENASMPCFRQTETTIESGQTLWVSGKIMIADDHSAWAPRVEIIDPAADPLVDTKNSPLASDVIPVPDGSFTDWQNVDVNYTNNGLLAKKVYIRCSAQRSKGNVYEVCGRRLED